MSLRRAYRKMAHLDWIGSMILLLWLHASANRVVFEYSSIVRRRACCAPVVIESASSRMTSLCRPSGRVTFFCANDFIRSRTTSMPLGHDGCQEFGPREREREREREDWQKDGPLVRGVEFEDALLVVVSEQGPRECEDTGRLADTGRALHARVVRKSQFCVVSRGRGNERGGPR